MSGYDDRDAALMRDPTAGQRGYAPPQYYGQQYPYGWNPYGGRYRRGMGMGMGMGGPGRQGWAETKPFFLTSEFLGTLLCILAVALTAATSPIVGARLACILATALVGAYTLSRGIAKSGTHSRAHDPRDELNLRGSGDGGESRTAEHTGADAR
jgi:hypothetical protein